MVKNNLSLVFLKTSHRIINYSGDQDKSEINIFPQIIFRNLIVPNLSCNSGLICQNLAKIPKYTMRGKLGTNCKSKFAFCAFNALHIQALSSIIIS